jgi:hypothetical protein
VSNKEIDWNELKKPFLKDDVKYRIQSMTRDNTSALVLAYVSSRAIQDRLDGVVGPENWYDSYEEWHIPAVDIPPGTAQAGGVDYSGNSDAKQAAALIQEHYQTGVKCRLAVKVNGEWLIKEGVSQNSDIQPLKGGESGSFKRAAIKLGIGRYLYNLPNLWIPVQLARPDGDGWEWTQYKGKDVYYRKPNLEAFGAPSSGETAGKSVVAGGTGTVVVGETSVADLASRALSGQNASTAVTPPSALTPAEVQDFQARISEVIQNNADSLKYFKEIPAAPDSMTKVSKMLGCLYYVCAQNVPGGEHEGMIRTATASKNFGEKLKILKSVLEDVEARRYK